MAKQKFHYFSWLWLFCIIIPVFHASATSRENSLDRVQAGEWVVASMYWEDKLDASGNKFDPIGWHAAHKTLPMGTLIRVSNPQNHRSIVITINDRGPFVPGRDLDLSLGAGALLGFQGSGSLYMEVLSIPPNKTVHLPVVENLFSASDTRAEGAPARPASSPAPPARRSARPVRPIAGAR